MPFYDINILIIYLLYLSGIKKLNKNMNSMNNIKVSIIIPVFNVENYLVKCLESITAQTMQELEIICINDGSTDNSLEILKHFAQKDERIIIINKENEGQGIAKNIGLQNATGEYIGFVDPADWIDEHMYEYMYKQAKNLNSEIVICDFISYKDCKHKAQKEDFFLKAVSKTRVQTANIPSNCNIDKNIILDTLLVTPSYCGNKIYLAKFLKDFNIDFLPQKYYENIPFTLKCMVFANNISYTDSPFYRYRIHKSSTLQISEKQYYEYINTCNEVKEFISQNNLTQRLQKNLIYFCSKNAEQLWNQLPSKHQHTCLKLFKNSLSTEEFKIFRNLIHVPNNFEKIFSVTNENGHKIINILGVKIKAKYQSKSSRKIQKYINKIIFNQYKYKKDTYLLFDCLNGNDLESIDAYSLFKYMKEKGLRAQYVVIKNSKLHKQLIKAKELDNIIVIRKPILTHPQLFLADIYEILLRTKTVITSFDIPNREIQQKFKEIPFFKYIFIQHGQIFLDGHCMRSGYIRPQKYDYMLISSKEEENILKRYGFSDKELIRAGLPRWDLLPTENITREKSILIMPTWRRFNILQFEDSLYKKNLLKFLSNRYLNYLSKEENIKIYFAPHHALKGMRNIDFVIDNSNIEIADVHNISKYIKECSCLVTDFSSVSFDFMFQNKPVICYIPDYNDYKTLSRNDRADLECFDYKKLVFPNVYFDEENTINKLKYYVENNFELEENVREKYAQYFFTKENIREKLTEEILKITE